MRRHWRYLYTLVLVALLGACAAPKPVQVVDKASKLREGDYRYKVVKGDTLYSIAWRYGLDYQRFAAANNIRPPYRIKPGQVLLLAVMGKPKPVVVSSKPKARSKPKSKVRPKSKPKTAQQRPKTQSKPQVKSNLNNSSVNLAWSWPIQAKVAKGFNLNRRALNQGVDFAAVYGQTVKAAASGQVVYAGNGIKGYGNLVIIKHNSRYLSAYAHNRRILVREGDKVSRGKKIAEVGLAANGKAILHFEIRKHGQPINPLKVLPRAK